MKLYEIISESKKTEAPKPRNFVAKHAKTGGAGAHKDKKKAQKQGDVKHKAKQFAESVLKEEEYDYYRDYKAGLISWEEYQELVNRDKQREKEQQWAAQERDRGPWYIKINGKIYKQKGVPKSFDWKSGAIKYGQAILKNNPNLKIVLTKKNQDDAAEGIVESGTQGSTVSALVNVGAVYKNKPGKTPKNKDGTAKNALDMDANLLTGGSIRRR